MIVGIQQDDYGVAGSSSVMWKTLLEEQGIETRDVDVYLPDILSQLKGCAGFMWRWGHYAKMRQVAKRLLPVLENDLGMCVYPSQATCRHYDDKGMQSLLFTAYDIPTPETWVFYSESAALQWIEGCTYPVVVKLSGGAGASNVVLLKTQREAREVVFRLFSSGVRSLSEVDTTNVRDEDSIGFLLKKTWQLMCRRNDPVCAVPPECWEVHKDYVLFQEFIPHNEYDTRVTIIGNRAFGYRRYNRPDDFRASGSGSYDVSPELIDQRAVKLAFQTAKKLRTDSCGMDIIWKNGVPLVVEVSYTYVTSMVHECPGHWVLKDDASLQWVDGHLWPEQAQIDDFVVRLASCD
ncbi:MAG: hypothetical protein EOL87_12580 [Spartobacteria bacterium]|nr:hypothetical protein [Spartobacteria bacterium]